MGNASDKIKRTIRKATPRAFRTIWWIFKITASVSFVMFMLRWLGILRWVSVAVSPAFLMFGLPGEAALAYVSGYFNIVYSCVAVISTLDLSAREITILGTMTLAAHAMILESAVQRKTGTSFSYCFLLRTASSLALGILLNLILPGRPMYVHDFTPLSDIPFFNIQPGFMPMLTEWAIGLGKLTLWMICLIWFLNVVQRLLYEFGVIERITRFFKPLLTVFGLPHNTSFLWIIANVVGLSYGSAVMMDELEHKTITQRDIDLLNTHIGISHSNFEDLLLLSACGGIWYIILLSRWLMAIILVWGRRYFLHLSATE